MKSAQKGQVTVEFLLMVPLIFIALTYIVEFGNIMYNKITLTHAVQAGAFTWGATRDTSAATATVKSTFGGDDNKLEVTFSPSADGNIVTASAVYHDPTGITFIQPNMTLKAQAAAAVTAPDPVSP